MGNLRARIRTLVTGRIELVDVETGETHYDTLNRVEAWEVAGIHSYEWWWVQKFGQLGCGCVRNPLTRRLVAFDFDCPAHGVTSDEEPVGT